MSTVELRVPTIGESVTEVTLSQWLKADGEYVDMDEPICEFESDKATLEFPAEASGKLIHVASEGDDLEVGDLVARIDTDVEAKEAPEQEPEEEDVSEERAEEKQEQTKEEETKEEEEHYAEGHASPAAAKLMREHELKPDDVEGSGKDGRILKEDVQQALEDRPDTEQEVKPKEEDDREESSAKERIEEEASTASTGQFSRKTTRKRMSRMRRTIASHLVAAKNETAMLTTFNEVDLTEVIALRKKYQEEFVEKFGIKLGFMSIFAKACAKVLLEMPEVNAFKDGDELIYHDYADISIAISTDKGLVVPPVHNVESLHFADIEQKIKELAEKAREGTLSLEEMQGGTFTITNGGIFGSLVSTPILNAPQSAILGMHSIQERPVAIDGEVEVRPMMYLALSYDHQVIDGKSAVTFLVKVKELLEDPMKLYLDL